MRDTVAWWTDDSIVVSVAHSGTRSLVEYLGLESWRHFTPEIYRILETYGGTLNVPVRNPYKVATSWAMRHQCSEGTIARMVGSFDLMMEAVYKLNCPVHVHVMEDLAHLNVGAGEWDADRKNPWVRDYQDAVARLVIPKWPRFWQAFNYPAP